MYMDGSMATAGFGHGGLLQLLHYCLLILRSISFPFPVEH